MLGQRLRQLREQAGLTQLKLGTMLHVSKNTISNYERNIYQPSDPTKMEIARIFGVTLDYLNGNSDHASPYLSGNAVHIPEDLPERALSELEIFMDYLVYKYRKR